jgi:ABC-type multidrug transport system ATPase subunit
MKITKINIPESKDDGLKEINMSRLDNIVLIAGRNGAGKTRILNKIMTTFRVKPIKSNLRIFEPQIRQLEENIKQFKQAITHQEQQLANIQTDDIQKISDIRLKVRNFNNNISNLKNEMDSKNSALRWSQIETDIESDEYSVIEFVPKNLNLQACDSVVKSQLHINAQNVEQLGIGNLPQGVFPKIQLVQDRWFNATHQNSSATQEEKTKAIDDYGRLREIINVFLETDITRTIDDQATLFGLPLDQSNLSDGQKVLLQLCIAIYSQGTKLSDLILFLDEPENHLHPSVIIETIERIEKCVTNGQIWIATHSVPLLAHFDPKYLWFVEDGQIKYSGKTPEHVLKGLLGDDEEISKLQNFISLPGQFATSKYAFDSLFEPGTVPISSNDLQTLQIRQELLSKTSNGKLRILDYGAGKGRIIGNLLDINIKNREDLIRQLDYIAYDERFGDKDTCIRTISSVYGTSEKRYYNDLTKLFTDYDKETFDIVLMCNVLHEIDPESWIELFKPDGTITSCLNENGILLLVEDCRMPTGELAYQKGFLVLDSHEIRILFKIPENTLDFKINSEKEGRLKAHQIPKKFLVNICHDSKKNAITEIANTAKREIKRIRSSGDKGYETGLMHGFWTQQLANADLNLDKETN